MYCFNNILRAGGNILPAMLVSMLMLTSCEYEFDVKGLEQEGRLFMLGGEEFGRTKQGRSDTHKDPIQLNRLDWQRAWANQDLVDYYRGLMALRKQLPALCDKSPRAAERILQTGTPFARCVTLWVDNAGSRWGELYLVYNASGRAHTIDPDGEDWEVLADGESSFVWQNPRRGRSFWVQPGTALILGKPSQI